MHLQGLLRRWMPLCKISCSGGSFAESKSDDAEIAGLDLNSQCPVVTEQNEACEIVPVPGREPTSEFVKIHDDLPLLGPVDFIDVEVIDASNHGPP